MNMAMKEIETDYVERLGCELYGVDYDEFTDFLNHNSLNRSLNEEDFGKEKCDNFYNVIAFCDGYMKATFEMLRR
jgi:hypothetical protein